MDISAAHAKPPPPVLLLRLVMRWYCYDWYKRPENKMTRYNDPEALDTVASESLLSQEERREADHQQEEMLQHIYKVLPCLTLSRQTILTLYFKYGLSHGQIARRYTQSNSAIHHELQKGLDQLKRMIHTQKRLATTTVAPTLPVQAERALGPQELALYRMRREAKMGFAEIAERMGMPQGEVQRQYVQLCIRLQKNLVA
ncbi:MAG TPA: hypothetical protein VGM41_14245 [Chitinophagaceae bacterium]